MKASHRSISELKGMCLEAPGTVQIRLLNAQGSACNHDSTVSGWGVTEAVVELLGSAFHLLKHAFDGVSIIERFVSKVHTEFVQSSLEPRCSVDEKFSVLDVVFLIELPQKSHPESEILRFEQPTVEYLGGHRINRSDEPILFTFDLEHRFIECHFRGMHPPRGSRSAFFTHL